MLTEIVPPQPKVTAGSDANLSALAEHLSVIADALRQSTGDAGAATVPLPHIDAAGPDVALQRKMHADAQSQAVGTPQPAKSVSQQAMSPSGQGYDPATIYANTAQPDPRMSRRVYGDLAREAYAVRRRRTTIFDNNELFGEPAWDILLDLYIANVEDKSVSVSSACIGSAAPPTTGLRWLGVLSEQGLIAREHDPEDQRRVLVRLTEKGLCAMDEYFASLGLNP